MQLKIIELKDDISYLSSCEHCRYGKEYGSNMFCVKRKEIKYPFDWCSHWRKKKKLQNENIFSSHI